MKKMDDIMELLIDEISGFQKSIEKLEGLSSNLNDFKLKVDTSKIEFLLKENLRTQERVQSQNRQALKKIDEKLKRSKLIPKWLLVLFLSSLLIMSITFGYLGFQVVKLNREAGTFSEKAKMELPHKK